MFSESLLLTLKVALVTTIILLLVSTPIAWWVVSLKKRYRVLVEAVLALPLILPPTVLGFYLLIILNPEGLISSAFRSLGFSGQLTFNFTGLVIGSVVYSLPFAIQPLVSAFSKVPKIYLDSAKLLGAGSFDRFISIVLPLSKGGFVLGGVLSFAHTIGEFGVVMMIGGNIPGVTRVVSIDIYNQVEALNFHRAHELSLLMLLFSLVVLVIVYSINLRGQGRRND